MNSAISMLLALTALAACPVARGQASFRDLGNNTTVLAVSADGSTVLGTRNAQYWRWGPTDGPNGSSIPFGSGSIMGQSGDGSVLVGQRCGEAHAAFRWSRDDGFTVLNDTCTPAQNIARCVSADGRIVAGTAVCGQSVWWEASGILHPISPNIPPPFALSRDGGRIATISPAGWWSRSNQQFVLIPPLVPGPPGTTPIEAAAMSLNGSTIVGRSISSVGRDHAFRWRVCGGQMDLGALNPATDYTTALAVSSSGKVVVGRNDTLGGSDAFVWEESRGLRPLQAALSQDYSLAIPNYIDRLVEAVAISANGAVIAGNALVSGEGYRGFIVYATPLDSGCPQDFDADGCISSSDVALFVSAWSASVNAGTLAGDYDGNGVVNTADVGSFITAWYEAINSGRC